MRINVQMALEVDPDHPYIDSSGSGETAIELLLEDWIFDDDYVTILDMEVSEG